MKVLKKKKGGREEFRPIDENFEWNKFGKVSRSLFAILSNETFVAILRFVDEIEANLKIVFHNFFPSEIVVFILPIRVDGTSSLELF